MVNSHQVTTTKSATGYQSILQEIVTVSRTIENQIAQENTVPTISSENDRRYTIIDKKRLSHSSRKVECLDSRYMLKAQFRTTPIFLYIRNMQITGE